MLCKNAVRTWSSPAVEADSGGGSAVVSAWTIPLGLPSSAVGESAGPRSLSGM